MYVNQRIIIASIRLRPPLTSDPRKENMRPNPCPKKCSSKRTANSNKDIG